MGDDRRTSASDELVDRAREGANSDFGTFEPEPIRAPDYDDMLDLDTPSMSGEADDGLSAAEIAAQLAEMGAVEAPGTGHRAPDVGSDGPEEADEGAGEQADPTSVSASIPEWARNEAQEIPIPEGQAEPPIGAGPVWSDTPTIDDGGDRWNRPTSEWEAYQAERDAKRAARSRFDVPLPSVRTLIGIAVLGFFLIPVIVNVVGGREHISTLDVGDCFMAGSAFEVETVPVVDCSEEHDSELFAKVEAADFGSGYPGQEPLFEWAFEQCIDRFEGYIGEPYEVSPYYVETFIPLEESWADGDRTALCTIVVVDSNLETIVTTGSRRNIAGQADA